MLEYADDVIVEIGGDGLNSGLGIWGSIVGQLSSQTDLYTLLSGSNQILSYDEPSYLLTLSNGNVVSLSALANQQTFLNLLSTQSITISSLKVLEKVTTKDAEIDNLKVNNNVNVGGTVFTGTTAIVLGTYFNTIGNNVNQEFILPHNLGTRDVSVVVRELSSNRIIYPTVEALELSSIKISFTSIPSPSAYGVSIFAGVPSTRVTAFGSDFLNREIANTIFVTVSGNDNNTGRDQYNSLRTIKKACEIAHNARVDSFNDPAVKFTVIVGTGDFYEDNPVYIPPNTSIIGDNLRRCSIIPLNKQFDIFWMDNSSYAWGFTFREHLEGSAGAAFPVLSNPLLTSIGFKNLRTPFVRRTLNFNREKCTRDLGFILSAVQTDIINGNNTESVYNGQFYYNGVISVLPADQVVPTADALDYAKSRVLAAISTYAPDSSPAVHIAFNTITSIITGGVNNYSYTIYTPSSTALMAAQLIEAQTENIKRDVLTYLDNKYSLYKWRKPFITTSPYVQGASSITRALNPLLQRPVLVNQKLSNSVATSGTKTLSSVEASFNTVIGILSGGKTNFSNLTYTPQSDTNFVIEAITKYEPYIKEATITHITSLYPTLSYSQAKCRRDVGFILSGIRVDLQQNNNNSSILNGEFYYDGIGASVLPADQIEPTVYALQKAKQITTQAILGNFIKAKAPLSLTSIFSAINTVANIIQSGPGGYPAITFTPPADAAIAVDLLLKHENYIRNETVAYVKSVYPNLTGIDAKCNRDVGFILSGVRIDITNGNNARSIINGQFYQGGALPNDQVAPTINAVNYIKTLAEYVVTGEYEKPYAPLTAPNISTLIDTTINIINNGINSFVPARFTRTLDTTKAVDLLRLNRGYIQDKTLEYLDVVYPDLVYNKELCYRDVSYILSGIQIDLEKGNNLESFRSGKFYFVGQAGNNLVFPEEQRFPTVVAMEEVKRLAQYVVTGNYNDRSDIDRCVDTINSIIVRGPGTSTPVVSSISPGALEAVQYLEQNKTFIQKELIGYLNTVYPGLQYDKAKCERDVGFILSAIQLDMQTGSNVEGIRAGEAYYNGMQLYLPEAQVAPTVAAFNYVKRLAKFVSQDKSVEGLGAGAGMRIDGGDAEGFLRSFVLDSYTQFNEGGKGIHILNNGYAQLVSIFTICCTEGMLCESGGSCSINTSNCSFGLSGLVATGKSPVAVLSGALITNPFGGTTVNINNVQGTIINPDSGYFAPGAPIDTRRIAFVPYNGMLFTIGNDPALYVIDGSPVLDPVTNTYAVETTQNIRTNYEPGVTVRFYIRSTITASAHTMEYIGSGISLANAVPALGGVTTPEVEAVFDNGGVVFFTSTNQAGNFRVGPGFTVVQETGTIEGQVFERSIITLVTPITLALE